MKVEPISEIEWKFCLKIDIRLTKVIELLVKKTVSIITRTFTKAMQGNRAGSAVNNLDENTITGKLGIGVSMYNKYTIRETSVPRP